MIRYVRNTLLALAGTLLLWTAGLRWDLTKSDWAAWVQALGSISAIIGAIWIVERQVSAARELEANRRHKDDLVKTEVLNQLFKHAVKVCDQILASTKGKDVNLELVASQLSDCICSLDALPPLDIPGEGLALARLHLPRALKELQEPLQSYLKAGARFGLLPTDQFMSALQHAGAVSRTSQDVAIEQISLLKRLAHVSD